MSDTQSPKSVMSYEQIMGLFQKIAEDSEKAQEEAKAERAQFQKELEKLREAAEKQRRITDKKISDLGDRIGQLVEEMVEGGVVRKFNKLGYTFNIITKRGTTFESKELGLSCEVDLFL
ncbi:MAG: hypothetical protein LBT89_01885, partial [Planctomycetaceae bacterium]|nr:hypothetical protein [Planctomycetaceae bacterium]